MAKIRRKTRGLRKQQNSLNDSPDTGLMTGLKPGVRMKGGVGFNASLGGWVVIVHTWDNADCIGEPSEWSSKEVFDSEDKAMSFYKKTVRPQLNRLSKDIQKDNPNATLDHRKLE